MHVEYISFSIRLCTQSVEVSLLICVELLEVDIRPLSMLLLQVFVQRILVAEDEV